MSKSKYAGVDPRSIIAKLQGKGVRVVKFEFILGKGAHEELKETVLSSIPEDTKLSDLTIDVRGANGLGIRSWGRIDWLRKVHKMSFKYEPWKRPEPTRRERMNLGVQVAAVLAAKRIPVEQD